MCDNCLHYGVCRYIKGLKSMIETSKINYNGTFSIQCKLYKYDEEKFKENVKKIDEKHGINK